MASTPAPDDAGRPTAAVLAGLRIVLHVAFAGLLVLGLVRALTGGGAPVRGTAAVGLAGAAVALAAVYLAGTVRERRLWRRGALPPVGAALGWLALVLACWALLVLHHPDFTWLAFPLFFVVLHVVGTLGGRPGAAVAVVAGLTAVVAAASALRDGVLAPGAVLGPVIGAAVAVVMYHAYRLLHAESERQRAVAEQLRAARAELAASERHAGTLAERERLAREIHDTLTQGLASIVLVSRAAQDALDAGDPVLAAARLQTVRDTAAENLAESRAFVRGLRAPLARPADAPDDAAPAPGAALTAALEAVVRGFRARQAAAGTPVRAEFEAVGAPAPVPEPVETVLVRAAQASLANVAQHADAARCRVTLTWMDGEVALDVADDGRGFTPGASRTVVRPRDDGAGSAAGEGTGVGLAALRERVAGVGGRVAVESAPGEGTVVAVAVPLGRGPGGSAGEEQTWACA